MPYQGKWTKEKIKEEFQIQFRQLGHSPSKAELPYLVFPANREYGSWNKAKKACRIPINKYPVNLIGYEGYKSDRSKAKLVRDYLRNNPATLEEIKENIEGIKNQDILQQVHHYYKSIGAVGPRKYKVYHLFGQEESAKKKLEEILAQRVSFEEQFEQNLLQLLNRPMEVSELLSNFKSEYFFENSLKALEKKDKIRKLRKIGLTRFSGKISVVLQNGSWIYKPGQEEMVADFILSTFPDKMEITSRLKGTITYKMRHLPEQILRRIKAYVEVKKY